MRTFILAIFLIIYFLISLPYLLFLLIIKLFNNKLSRRLTYKYIKFTSSSLFWICGTKLHVEGREKLDTENYLIVANHYSLFDTPIVFDISNSPVGFFGKKELLYTPFINILIYLSGGYFLDRKNLKKGLKTILKGIERLKDGDNMVIFPQGTRVKDDKFLPFKKGSLKLATASNSKVIPVCIYGSDNIYEANGKKIKAADVYIYVFDPIETKGMSREEQKELSTKIENLIYSKYMEYKNNTI